MAVYITESRLELRVTDYGYGLRDMDFDVSTY